MPLHRAAPILGQMSAPQTQIEVAVDPSVLRWARDSAGVSRSEAAAHAGVSEAILRGWEGGLQKPSLSHLRNLAAFYARPLAALLLPEPPTTPPLPVDFRRGGGDRAVKLGRQTRLALRISSRLQLAAVELAEGSPFPVGTAAIADDVIEVARRERRNLGVDLREQIAWTDHYEALHAWREAAQDRGSFVFQLPMPTKELRGFSLSRTSPPVIVFSSSDSPAARIFTLIHEYGHLLLGAGGMCLPDTAPGSGRSVIAEESFCNSFAGALLVPSDDLVRFVAAQAPITADVVPPDEALTPIANRYRVSRQVVWYRLFGVGIVTESVFREKWAEWRGRSAPNPSSGGRGRTSAERALAQYGSEFVGVVLGAHASGRLSTSDALDYLSIHSRHWSELTHLVGVA